MHNSLEVGKLIGETVEKQHLVVGGLFNVFCELSEQLIESYGL